MKYIKFTNVCFIIFTLTICSLSQEKNNQYNEAFLEARFNFHKTYFEKATGQIEELISQEQNDPLLYAYAAATDFMLFKDPDRNINKAHLLLKKDIPNYFLINALCYFAQQDFSKCLLNIKKHLSDNPADKFSQHILGFIQIDLNKYEEGLNTLQNLIINYPDYYPAYNHLGYAYLRLNKKSEALNAFKKFIAGDELNPSAFDSYAEGLSQFGEKEKAIAQLVKAVLLEPNFAYGWKHMGDIFSQNKQNVFAIKAYENAKSSANLYGESFINSIQEKISNLKRN